MRFRFLDKVLPQNRILYKAEETANLVIAKQEEYSKKTDEELRSLSDSFITHLAEGKIMEDIIVDALCVIRETMYRAHGMMAYKCQLIGALVVNYGDFAEMMTGEGKTLTLVLAAYLGAIYKKGVHMVTVNEYLVQRDAEFAEHALARLGLTCGYITAAMQPDEKRINYNYDVTYVSNSELGFDYLRDNLVKNYADKVQRGLYFAIVDEADSVLIDEARTPLIIAGQSDEDVSNYIKVDRFVKTLKESDYIIDLESHSITLSDSGAEKAEQYFNIDNIYDVEYSDLVHKIGNALRAIFIFNNGVEYIVRNNHETHQPEIALVDAFTGRIMEGRTYSAGLHQAIQAKEMVQIEPENTTIAILTYQSFFRMYHKLAGVSGTAYTESEEILNIYNMVVVQIPTNKPVIRHDYPDYIFDNKKVKWKYVVAEIKKRYKTKQPILIGTGSVEDSEILHLLLTRIGIPHTVLNAKNHAQEAEIVKEAGQLGKITIATYMAGRGTDIKLGPGVRELGGLYVIGTERNESRRVDNQLRGRSGRQGDPGESRFFISLQDNLFKRFAGDKFQQANDKMSDDVIDTKFFSKLLDYTQKRIEGLNYDSRKSLIDYDYVFSSQRELFYKQRDIILLSENLLLIVKRMCIYVIDYIINQHIDEVNVDIVKLEDVIKHFNEEIFHKEILTLDMFESYKISHVKAIIYEELIKFVDELASELDIDGFNRAARDNIVSYMDRHWSWFLERVSKTKENVNLRAYEQKSPLNIFIEEVDKAFKELITKIAYNVITSLTANSLNDLNQTMMFESINQLSEQEQPSVQTNDPNNPFNGVFSLDFDKCFYKDSDIEFIATVAQTRLNDFHTIAERKFEDIVLDDSKIIYA